VTKTLNLCVQIILGDATVVW